MATDKEAAETAIRIISFSGKKADWRVWNAKFMTKARMKGWVKVLTSDEAVLTDEELERLDPRDPTYKAKMANKRMNDQAFNELMLSMDTTTDEGDVAFGIVSAAMTDDFTNGRAAEAYANLQKKYDPTSAPSMVKITRQFYKATLGKGEDPDVFINKLERLRVQILRMDKECKVSDKSFINVILNSLPSEYEHQVSMLEERMDSGEVLTIEKLRETLNRRFKRIEGNEDNDEEDQALYAGGKFKGKCYNDRTQRIGLPQDI
jgi:hypothetical protein